MEKNLLILGEAIHNALVECSLKEGQFSDNFEGACAIASAFFIKEAKRLFGMRISFRASSEHAWATYKGIIYDLTATQFGQTEQVFTILIAESQRLQSLDKCVL